MNTSQSRPKPLTSILDRARMRNGSPLEKTRKGRPRIATHDGESYIVPIVAKAIDISELLQNSSGLHVKGIRELTGYSDSTIYRILRTLAAFGYVGRDSNGVYRLDPNGLQIRKNSVNPKEKKTYVRSADSTPHPPITDQKRESNE